jgi:two-component system CitB family response regulator
MTLQVLVVDDDFRVARLHAATVERVPGFQVAHVSSNLADAIRHLTVAGGRIDLAVLDLYLPDGSGLDLMRRVNCDVFVVSAAAESATVRTALSRGALAYLIKPFPEEMLAERLTAYARYRAVLDRVEVVGQTELDLALRTLHAPSANRPKGHSALTEQAVTKAVVEAGAPVSAAAVADQVGISRATAQRYLSLLADGGTIVMQLRYGSTGRPEHRFSAPDAHH